MAFTTPIIDLIADNIATTVNTVTTVNGDNYTLNAHRPRKKDIKTPWEDLEVLINQVESDALTTELQRKNWRQFFWIVVFLRDSDEDTDPIDTRRNRIVADIQKKLTVDLTRGNFARDTNFHGGTTWDSNDGSLGGIALKISVDYATKNNDPYTKG